MLLCVGLLCPLMTFVLQSDGLLLSTCELRCVQCIRGLLCTQVQVHVDDLAAFTEPLVVNELPGTLSALQYATGDRHSDHLSLGTAFSQFMADDAQCLVLVGDSGCGKSSFLWHIGLDGWEDMSPVLLQTPMSRLGGKDLPWLPIVAELKLVRACVSLECLTVGTALYFAKIPSTADFCG